MSEIDKLKAEITKLRGQVKLKAGVQDRDTSPEDVVIVHPKMSKEKLEKLAERVSDRDALVERIEKIIAGSPLGEYQGIDGVELEVKALAQAIVEEIDR